MRCPRSPIAHVAVALLFAAVPVGCGQDTTDDASPDPTASPSGDDTGSGGDGVESSGAGDEAPDPCSLLDAETIGAEFGVEIGEAEGSGITCAWSDEADSAIVVMTVAPHNLPYEEQCETNGQIAEASEQSPVEGFGERAWMNARESQAFANTSSAQMVVCDAESAEVFLLSVDAGTDVDAAGAAIQRFAEVAIERL